MNVACRIQRCSLQAYSMKSNGPDGSMIYLSWRRDSVDGKYLTAFITVQPALKKSTIGPALAATIDDG